MSDRDLRNGCLMFAAAIVVFVVVVALLFTNAIWKH